MKNNLLVGIFLCLLLTSAFSLDARSRIQDRVGDATLPAGVQERIDSLQLPAILAVDKSCGNEASVLKIPYLNQFETQSTWYALVVGTRDQLTSLTTNPCVKRSVQSDDKNEFFSYVQNELRSEVQQKLSGSNVQKFSRGLSNFKDLNTIVTIPSGVPSGGMISPYQYYVMPTEPSVTSIANGKTSEQIYSQTASWVWISDLVLNKVQEKWFTPKEFITVTPTMPTNPTKGRMVSDCEEQANTLVSLLRASGVAATDVRVALGIVDFGDENAGHAWTEILLNNQWVVLDTTGGPYWDDQQNKLTEETGFSYDYWVTHPYPVVDNWAFYNDQYFVDVDTKTGNAPTNWGIELSSSNIVEQKLSFSNLRAQIKLLKDINSPTTPTQPTLVQSILGDIQMLTFGIIGLGLVVLLLIIVGIFFILKKSQLLKITQK